MGGFRIRLGHTDMGHFRVGIRRPWNVIRAIGDGHAEQGGPDDKPRLIPSDMSELQAASCIANGIDLAIARAQALVDNDAGAIGFYTGGFQI